MSVFGRARRRRTPARDGQRRSQAPSGAGRVRPPKPAPSPPNPSALPPLARHELASRHKLSGICCCDPVCMKGGGTRDSPFPSCTWCGLLLGLTIPGLGLVCCLRQASPPARLLTPDHTHAQIPRAQHHRRTRSRPHLLDRPDCEMFGCTCNRVVHPVPSRPKRGRGGFFESIFLQG